MSESRSGDTFLAFLLGAIAGAVAGVLIAPAPGAKTRKRLGEWIKEQEEKGNLKQTLTEAWEKGKKAYREREDR